jgi:hypothetical protein
MTSVSWRTPLNPGAKLAPAWHCRVGYSAATWGFASWDAASGSIGDAPPRLRVFIAFTDPD